MIAVSQQLIQKTYYAGPFSFDRGVNQCTDIDCFLRLKLVTVDIVLARQETSMDGQIRAFSMLHPPPVREGITGKGYLHAFPLQNKAYGTLQVDRRNTPDGHAILLVDDVVLL